MSRDGNDARQRVPHTVTVKGWRGGRLKALRTERCTDPNCEYTDNHSGYEYRK